MREYVFINNDNKDVLDENYDLIIFYKKDFKRKIIKMIFKIFRYKSLTYISNNYIIRKDLYDKYKIYNDKQKLIKILENEDIKIKEIYDENSKICFMDFIKYLLYSIDIKRFIKFASVGFLGLLFNLFILHILFAIINIPFFISSMVAIQLSIIFVFLLNDIFVFKDRKNKKFYVRLLENHIVRISTSILQYLLSIFFFYILNINYLISQALSIFIVFILNYIFSMNFIWKTS